MGEGFSRPGYDHLADTSNSSKLMVASSKGQYEKVTKLIKTMDSKKLNKRDERGETPLHHAAAMGYNDVLLLLLQKGSNVQAKAADGLTPFQLSILHGKKLCALTLLESTDTAGKEEMINEPFPFNPGVTLDYSVAGLISNFCFFLLLTLLDRSGVFTWTIKNFSRIEEKKLCSQVFQIGGVHWYLRKIPCNPDTHEATDCLSSRITKR